MLRNIEEPASKAVDPRSVARPAATHGFEGFDAKAPDGQGVDTRAPGSSSFLQAQRSEAAPAAGRRECLEVAGLNLYYGENKALNAITMSIPERQVTAFIGPSGCGKSTLLRCFNRMNDLYDHGRRRCTCVAATLTTPPSTCIKWDRDRARWSITGGDPRVSRLPAEQLRVYELLSEAPKNIKELTEALNPGHVVTDRSSDQKYKNAAALVYKLRDREVVSHRPFDRRWAPSTEKRENRRNRGNWGTRENRRNRKNRGNTGREMFCFYWLFYCSSCSISKSRHPRSRH